MNISIQELLLVIGEKEIQIRFLNSQIIALQNRIKEFEDKYELKDKKGDK